MNKTIKLFTLSLVSIFTLTSLTSCGLDQTEKYAKEYIKANPDNYEKFNAGGFGLSYKSETLSYDFLTSKGTYTTSSVSFKFDSNYDYESDNIPFKVTKITKGEEGSTLYKAAEAACKIELGLMFSSISLASTLYQNQQEK